MALAFHDAAPTNAQMSLLDIYNAYFEVVPATTPELLNEAHRLRYQVYCVENSFEESKANPDGLETDEFDGRSCQSLLVHRATGAVAGTVRLILPDERGSISLPALTVSEALRNHAKKAMPKHTTAEISRFSISKSFRRRIEDGRWPAVYEGPAGGEDNRRILPHMTLGLMQAIVSMSIENGITHWSAAVETPLLRLLKRLGIHFHSVGPLVEYHGLRQPVYNSLAELLDGIYIERPDVWDVITKKGKLRAAPVPLPLTVAC
jgi:N-acyl amino acid synthase of PEP-CTERM/exosortase system